MSLGVQCNVLSFWVRVLIMVVGSLLGCVVGFCLGLVYWFLKLGLFFSVCDRKFRKWLVSLWYEGEWNLMEYVMQFFLVMLLCVQCGGRYSMLFGLSINFFLGWKLVRILSGRLGMSVRLFWVEMCQWCLLWVCNRNILYELKCGLILLLLVVKLIIILLSCVFGMNLKCCMSVLIVGLMRFVFCISIDQLCVLCEGSWCLLKGLWLNDQCLCDCVIRWDLMLGCFVRVRICLGDSGKCSVCIFFGESVCWISRGFFCQCVCMKLCGDSLLRSCVGCLSGRVGWMLLLVVYNGILFMECVIENCEEYGGVGGL